MDIDRCLNLEVRSKLRFVMWQHDKALFVVFFLIIVLLRDCTFYSPSIFLLRAILWYNFSPRILASFPSIFYDLETNGNKGGRHRIVPQKGENLFVTLFSTIGLNNTVFTIGLDWSSSAPDAWIVFIEYVLVISLLAADRCTFAFCSSRNLLLCSSN